MLCPSCHRQLVRGATCCTSCGRPLGNASPPLELVLPDATRLPLLGELTIGRGAGSTVQLADPSVSRRHARIVAADDGRPVIEDSGSSYGTYLDGIRLVAPEQLRDGAEIAVGDQHLTVQRRRDDAEAGRTIVVPPGASLVVSAGATPGVSSGLPTGGSHPRVRAGYALKRLEAGEGSHRWVLRDLSGDGFLRLSERDAELFALLDGTRSLADLVGEAERRFGPYGPARLARLLADLGDRGLLAGVAGVANDQSGEPPESRIRRLMTPRTWSSKRLVGVFERLYAHGGWLLFTRPALVVTAAVAAVGLGVFAYLVIGRYGTPFVVASKLGLGGLVFLLGRFALVAAHEAAHGLALASYGRRPREAGIKVLVVFPFAFLDTSEAWFEPRRRRIAVMLAGPVCDLALGGLFSLCCLLLEPGAPRDVFFQIAFASYVGALFNLNPFIERDGYHVLVDALREPGLRRRAKDQLARRLSGQGAGEDSRVLAKYSLAGLAWWVLAALFLIGLSIRYIPVVEQLVPGYVLWSVLGTLWVAFFAPVFIVIVPPLVKRFRGPEMGAGSPA